MTTSPTPAGPSRRTIVKGAAWAAPVIAVAAATPAAAASESDQTTAPNDEANYYWDNVPGVTGDNKYVRLEPATGERRGTFSTQIAYRSDPWSNPPSAGELRETVTFSSPVTFNDGLPSDWKLAEDSSSHGTTFTFVQTKSSSFGNAGLTFNFTADGTGEITATASMTLLNPEREKFGPATYSEKILSKSTTIAD